MSRVKKKEVKNGSGVAIAALILLFLAVLDIAVCMGWCLEGIGKVQLHLLGRCMSLLPIGLLLLVLALAKYKTVLVFNKISVGSMLLFITALLACHELNVSVGEELTLANLPKGGGLIGGLLALGLHKLLSPVACWGVIAFLTLVILGIFLPFGEMHSLIKKVLFPAKKTEKIEEPEQQRQKLSISGKQKTVSEPSVWGVKLEEQAKAREESERVNNEPERVSVYDSEEFDSFTQGIRKEGTFTGAFKRILNRGEEDNNIYEQEDIKAEIEKDPVQLPEWEERGGSVVLRPVIHYGSEEEPSKVNEEEPANVNEGEQDKKTKEEGLKPPDQLLENQYRKLVNQELQKKIEATTVEMAQQEAETGCFLWDVDKVRYEDATVSEVQQPSIESVEQSKEVEVTKTIASEKPEISLQPSETVLEEHPIIEEPEAEEPIIKETTQVEKEPEYSEVYVRQDLVEPQEKVIEEEKSDYILPPIDLLNHSKTVDPALYEKDIREQCSVLEKTLADFKVKARVAHVTRGPSVTRFEVQPAPGVKVNTIVNLSEDIALRMAAPGVRMEAPIPGKAAIGIEVPNIKTDSVAFREIVENDTVQKEKSPLCIGLGKNISGDIITMDIAKMPHLLVAGSTGSGKSVCINTIIAGVLYKARPDEVKLILVDPKVVELTNYNGIPHLLTPVVTDAKKAASALHWAVAEMERRYQLFADNNVRKIDDFNAQAAEPIPYIVIIIDELSDLMMVARVDVEDAILRLAQKARACGIHLIIATQRPSVDVITGIVKANIPSRIAFAVSSNTDSRTILDTNGAEKLLGRGDMLFSPIGQAKPSRVQGAFVSDEELHKIVQFIVNQSIPVNYTEEVTQQELQCDAKAHEKTATDEPEVGQTNPYEDELFEDAVRMVLDLGQASASMLQRRFRIGFTRAGRLIDMMEELGIVGESQGSKSREVIMSRQEVEERFFNHE